jgi:hypothetical protein
MKNLCLILLAATAYSADDSEAVRKTIAAFNHPSERAAVLAPDADLSPLDHLVSAEVSQVYFEARTIRLITPDVAFVDVSASQYGTLILKRSTPAIFVLKREAGVWRIVLMRIVMRIP